MGKLIRMDLYRLLRSKACLVCLLITLILAIATTPITMLMFTVAKSLVPEAAETMPNEAKLSDAISDPFPIMGMMMVLLSLCYFFYADVENGYIKNIAGQMPMKGFTVLSKFVVALAHNIIFVLVSIIGYIIGTVFFQRIVLGDLLDSLRVLAIKLLLLQCISAILLLVVSTFRGKALGMILAVLFGLNLTGLIYTGIDLGIGKLLKTTVEIEKIMPDAVIRETPMGNLRPLLVGIVGSCVFLLPAVRIFDRKDVK